MASVLTGDGIFHRELGDSNHIDPYLESTDNGTFAGRESKLNCHFVPQRMISLDEAVKGMGRQDRQEADYLHP